MFLFSFLGEGREEEASLANFFEGPQSYGKRGPALGQGVWGGQKNRGIESWVKEKYFFSQNIRFWSAIWKNKKLPFFLQIQENFWILSANKKLHLHHFVCFLQFIRLFIVIIWKCRIAKI